MSGMLNEGPAAADVVVVGAGPAGLASAIAARDCGASVLVLEANDDIGGHAMLSGGSIQLGGGHEFQRQMGIEDSPGQIFADWTRSDLLDTRFFDRDLLRTLADANVETFEFLRENGVTFTDSTITFSPDAESVGPQSVRRLFRCAEWPNPDEVVVRESGRNGSGLVRNLERSARQKGVVFLLGHSMVDVTPSRPGGPVDRVRARTGDREVAVTAGKGVVLATGGSSGNVHLRRVFDPRLTEEYQTAGAPYTYQTGDGEIAAMKLGATLWGTGAQTVGTHLAITRTRHIGCQWGYRSLKYRTDSPIFDRVRATGLTVADWQNVILVNASGARFWNEEDGSQAFINAALGNRGGSAATLNGGGPIWAIFDRNAASREGWTTKPPHVDPNYFAEGGTWEELSRAIDNPYQRRPLDPAALRATVARYNGFVEAGADADFGKPGPRYKIEEPPFFAAWSTPMLHDSLTGLRTDTQGRVLTLVGEPIDGLFCAGESQGGIPQHGIARCVAFGRIAGRTAASRA